MKTELASVEKYPVIVPEANANPESVLQLCVSAVTLSAILWCLFSIASGFQLAVQMLVLLITLMVHLAKSGSREEGLHRTVLELKAKGLDIRDPAMTKVMPWDWLAKVEIRQRRFSIIPNYVYFKFKDQSDILILWDDVRADMDSVTLISSVRTWAPHAEIKGDANIARSESIATYTELWLKDLNLTTTDKRLRQDQMLPAGTVISERYKIERILSGGGQGTAYLASVLPQPEVLGLPPQVVIKEFILPANNRGMQKAKDSL
ncbi:MAG TPA: hypothetical protein V6C69_00385, partial [Trichormus sp.]